MRANLLMVLVANVMLAQNGSLDATFGENGVTNPEASYEETELKSVMLQSDGKIIACGRTYDHSGTGEYFIVRYNTDGTPDVAFGDNGKVESIYSDGFTDLQDMKLQSNGKIILKVRRSGTTFLVRHNANGALDTGFGTNGILSLPNPSIASFTLLPNDKLLISEVPIEDANLGFRLFRYNANGTLDTAFGTNGFVFIPAVDGGNLYSVTLLDNGKKLLSGSTIDGTNTNIGIVRYKSNWSLDASFGIGGKAIVNLDDTDVLEEIKIQDNDKILLVVFSYHNTPEGPASGADYLMRLKANGRIDNGYGTQGLITLAINPYAMVVQTDGKLVVSGGIPYTTEDGNIRDEIGLTRLRKNGNVDTSFGTNGIIRTSPLALYGANFGRNLSSSIDIQSDGKVVLGAVFCEAMYSCHRSSYVVRYNSNQEAGKESSGIPKAIIAARNFRVYPNPVNESFELDFNLPEAESLSIDLYDANGRLISNLIKETRFEQGNNTLRLELPETLSRGIYILTVSNGSHSTNVKIVK